MAAYQIQPDVAIVLEGTTASDVPGSDPHKHATSVGKGPAITIMDRSVITHPPLVRQLIELAENTTFPIRSAALTQAEQGGPDSANSGRNQGCCHCRSLPLHPFCRFCNE